MTRMGMVRSVRLVLEVIDGQYDDPWMLVGHQEGGGYVEQEAKKYLLP